MSVNILYQFNEKYVPFAAVSITSLFENNKDIENLVVYILEEDILVTSKEKIMNMGDKYCRKIFFIETADVIKYMKELKIPNYRNSYATNLKLFIDKKIPMDVERLLYIDSDTIVNDNIMNLYSIDMELKPLAMSLDSLGRTHSKLIGLTRADYYYNAGVILFDMNEWRKQKCTEQIVQHVKKVRAHYIAPDQDLLNIVFQKKIKTLEARYNFQPILEICEFKHHKAYFALENYYSEKEIKLASGNPCIVHFFRFLGEFPWHKNTQHPFTELFDYYLDISEWRDYIKEPSEQDGIIFQIERLLYRYLPKSIFFWIFKMNYEIFIFNAHRNSLKSQNNKMM